ncbi:MAG: hypothetical protein ABI592_05520 [Acidobacteriota bacterium]
MRLRPHTGAGTDYVPALRAPLRLAWIAPPVVIAALSLLLVLVSYLQPR